MPFEPAPPLPDFLAAELPFGRGAYRLEGGEDAGRRLHFIDHGPRGARPVLHAPRQPHLELPLAQGDRRACRSSAAWRRICSASACRTSRDASPSTRSTATATPIAELVAALDLRGAILAVQDWGGPIGAGVGARLPERFAGAVIANTSVLLPKEPKGTAFHRFARRPLVSDVAFRLLGFPLGVLHRVQGDPRSIRGAVARAYRWPLRRLRDRVAPLALARMVPDRPDHPSVPALRRGEAWMRSFGGPIALVWGTRDPILGRALKWHEKAFPDAPVTRTEAGHFLQEEVPGRAGGGGAVGGGAARRSTQPRS